MCQQEEQGVKVGGVRLGLCLVYPALQNKLGVHIIYLLLQSIAEELLKNR